MLSALSVVPRIDFLDLEGARRLVRLTHRMMNARGPPYRHIHCEGGDPIDSCWSLDYLFREGEMENSRNQDDDIG